MPLSQPSPRQLRVLAEMVHADAGERVRIDPSDADSCCDEGWVKLHQRRYVLTDAGRAVSAAKATP